MLVVFAPIFVADTKITFVYNFVAPLRIFPYIFAKCKASGFYLNKCFSGKQLS